MTASTINVARREGRDAAGTELPGSRGISALAIIVAVVGALCLGAPGPAAAIPGLERTEDSSAFSEWPVKHGIAACPPDKHVIGGGGRVYDGGRELVRLVALYPSNSSTSGDAFVAIAIAPGVSSDYDWDVTAYAVCADKEALSDYRIVRTYDYNRSTNVFQASLVRCSSGTVAYSAGGLIDGPGQVGWGGGEVGLQMVRTSGPIDIARATARASRASFDEPWQVRPYAVCARPQAGIHVDGANSLGAEVTGFCDSGYKVHGPGGGGGLVDGGAAALVSRFGSTSARIKGKRGSARRRALPRRDACAWP